MLKNLCVLFLTLALAACSSSAPRATSTMSLPAAPSGTTWISIPLGSLIVIDNSQLNAGTTIALNFVDAVPIQVPSVGDIITLSNGQLLRIGLVGSLLTPQGASVAQQLGEGDAAFPGQGTILYINRVNGARTLVITDPEAAQRAAEDTFVREDAQDSVQKDQGGIYVRGSDGQFHKQPGPGDPCYDAFARLHEMTVGATSSEWYILNITKAISNEQQQLIIFLTDSKCGKWFSVKDWEDKLSIKRWTMPQLP